MSFMHSFICTVIALTNFSFLIHEINWMVCFTTSFRSKHSFRETNIPFEFRNRLSPSKIVAVKSALNNLKAIVWTCWTLLLSVGPYEKELITTNARDTCHRILELPSKCLHCPGSVWKHSRISSSMTLARSLGHAPETAKSVYTYNRNIENRNS